MTTSSPDSGSASTRWHLTWAGIIAIGLALVLAYWVLMRPVEHSVITSPDGRFRLVVYREWALLPRMPGQGGDAPGFVRLIETKSGRVLHETHLEMVQLVYPIVWEPGRVSVRLLFDWPLPP